MSASAKTIIRERLNGDKSNLYYTVERTETEENIYIQCINPGQNECPKTRAINPNGYVINDDFLPPSVYAYVDNLIDEIDAQIANNINAGSDYRQIQVISANGLNVTYTISFNWIVSSGKIKYIFNVNIL